MDAYLSPQVERLTGLQYQVLDLWARSGVAPPSIRPARGQGRGRERLWSFRDVVALRIARELRDTGISRAALCRVVDHVRACDGAEDPGTFWYLAAQVKAGQMIVSDVRSIESLAALRRGMAGNLSLVIDLAGTVRELREAIGNRSGGNVGV